MAKGAYEVVQLDELESIEISGAGVTWRPIRRRLGIDSFGINAYTGGPGQDVVEEHTEGQLGHEEAYVVVRGRVRFHLDDEELEAPAGAIVYLRDPSTKRRAVALEDGSAVLAIGGKPGEAFQPSAWEWFFEAEKYRPGRDWDSAVKLLEDGVAAKPGSAVMLYHLACYEALAGRGEEALAHLRESVQLDERFRGYARDDEDFESLRERNEFRELIG